MGIDPEPVTTPDSKSNTLLGIMDILVFSSWTLFCQIW